MEQELAIEQRELGDIIILDLQGNLTIGPGEQTFKEHIQELVSKKQKKVLVNLQGVEFVDSSGVGALVKGFTTLVNLSGRLKLLRPDPMLLKTLKITGLLGIFEIFEEEGPAIASF